MKFIRLHVRSLFLLTALLAPWLLCLCDLAFGPSITDSSVFRYMGWRFATGTGGYARAWDCKGPVLVLFNAVGYWLGISPSVIFASVWSGIVFLFFRFLKRLRVAEPEGWTLLFFLLFVHMEGSLLMNGTETLAAFFSLVAVHSVWGARSPFRWLAVGAAAGAVFFTKANLISFAAALGLACAFQSVRTREFGRLAACFLCSLAGFAAVVAAVSLLFGSGGFREMWDAAIGYNLLERCAGVRQSYLGYWADRLFRQMWYLISAASFSAWAALGALLIVVGLSRSLRAPDARKAAYLTLTAWLILEMAMAFCSKGFYMHYTMVSVVPMLALLSLCVSDTPAFMTGGGGLLRNLGLACLPFFALFIKTPASYTERSPCVNAAVEEIAKIVPPGSRVAVLGSHATAEIMNRLHLTTDQKYFGWLFYDKNCFPARREEHRREFQRARESCDWLLTECDLGPDGLVRAFDLSSHHVYVYRLAP